MESGRALTPAAAALLDVLERGSVSAAPALLGATLTSDLGGARVSVRVTEVEAYREDDAASHSARGRTPRTAVMFGPAGHLYVYFVYGMHWAANVSCGPEGAGEAVLIRAGEVVEGVETAWDRRPAARREVDLARGPARLASALALDRSALGLDLLDPESPVRVVAAGERASRVVSGPRVGVNAAVDVRWRWWVDGDPTVSPYRPGSRRPGTSVRRTEEVTGPRAAPPKNRR